MTPARGTMPVLQFCAPVQLQVDAGYQRATDAQASRALINRIAREWDWRLYQPLVIARRADGNLYVVDGQHRLEAARLRGDMPQLPCVITSYDDSAEEAAAFVQLNQQRRPLTPMNLHRAAVAAGDRDAVLAQGLIEAAGLRLTGAADARSWKPGWINMIAAVRRILRQHGERTLRLSLEALAAGFPGQLLNSTSPHFAAIATLVVERGDGLSPHLLHALLQDAPATEWTARFRTAASDRGIGVELAAKQLLAEAYAEAEAE